MKGWEWGAGDSLLHPHCPYSGAVLFEGGPRLVVNLCCAV